MATPPVDVIVTTMTSVGCSTSTSMCRTDAVPRPGADTSASRRVTWESISVVDCSASSISLRIAERSSGNLAGRGIHPREHLLGVEAVAGARRDAPGGGVRMGEEPERLELGELVANGGGREAEPGALDERLRADGLARRDVLLHDPPQDVALAFAQLSHLQEFYASKLGSDAAAEEAAARR